MVFSRENLPDILRFLTGFLIALNLLLKSFGLYVISDEQIDAIVNVASFLFLMYWGFKNHYLTKNDLEAKKLLKENGLHK
ncbi:MAG: phage holin [Bacilli bacterium]